MNTRYPAEDEVGLLLKDASETFVPAAADKQAVQEALRRRLRLAGAQELGLRPAWPRLLRVAAGVVAACVLLALAWRWVENDPMVSAYAEVSRALDKEPPAGLRGSDIDEGLLKQLQRFYDAYSLAPGQNVKLIPEPFMPERATYVSWLNSDSGSVARLPKHPFTWAPSFLVFHWSGDGVLRNKWCGYGEQSLFSVCMMVLDLHPVLIGGDHGLLDKEAFVDVVRRADEQPEVLVAELARAFRESLGWHVQMSFKKVERAVVVVSGEYEYEPMPGYAASRDFDRIEVYGSERRIGEPSRDGIGSLTGFLEEFGDYIGRPAVSSKVVGVPDRFRWRIRPRLNVEGWWNSPLPAEETELAFQHLKEQTGLDCRLENREVRMLFVEPSKDASD